MTKLTKQQARVAKAIAAKADQGGTIQAADMLDLTRAGHIPTDPRHHTTTSLAQAWTLAGLPDDTAEQLWG